MVVTHAWTYSICSKESRTNKNVALERNGYIKLIKQYWIITYGILFWYSKVFNGKGNDRPDAPNVLLLFTDGQAIDKQGKDYQVEQAKKLKDDGVKVITVGLGKSETINKFRDKLREMASRSSDSAAPLAFETDFYYLDLIINNLVEEVCDACAMNKHFGKICFISDFS